MSVQFETVEYLVSAAALVEKMVKRAEDYRDGFKVDPLDGRCRECRKVLLLGEGFRDSKCRKCEMKAVTIERGEDGS